MQTKREKPYFIVRESGEIAKSWIKAGAHYKEYKEENNSFIDDNNKVTCDITSFGAVTKQKTTVTNTSNGEIKLNHVSSAYVGGIGKGGLTPWFNKERFLVHYCYSTWQGEGQWRSDTLSNLGLFRASNHICANVVRFSSVGSQSTSILYPLIFIEDKEQGRTHFFEIESGGNWYIEIGCEGFDENATLYVEMNSAFYNHDGWHKALSPNESFTATPTIFGTVDGNIEKAVKELVKYKRKTSKADMGYPHVCFNDYMNCLWAMPNDKKLIPLIDKAAEVGCELFCIDAGWYVSDGERLGLGDWIIDDSLFGSYNLEGIINYIKNKGMKPGVWLEIDSVDPAGEFAKEYADCLIKRDGVFAGSGDRYLLDFRKEKARGYIMGLFDKLYAMGVRFVKNDYNQTSGIGYDGDKTFGEELRESLDALYSFIDEVQEKYPDFMIENCGSGGMRADGAIMPHFELFSTSDQEYYYNNPSIVSGLSACVQPEKCGIWSFPYPLLYEDRKTDDFSTFFTGENAKKYEDGEETAFNMINAMFGTMYLSGHIEYADERNTCLIKDAIKLYKKNREIVKNGYPIYPNTMFRIDENGFYAYGLEDDEKILLALWQIDSKENVKTFDLSSYVGDSATAKLVYPSMPTAYNFVNNRLSVKLDNKYSARLFEIKKEG